MQKNIFTLILFVLLFLSGNAQSLFDSIGYNGYNQPLPSKKITIALNYCDINLSQNPLEVYGILVDAKRFMQEHKELNKWGEYYYILANYYYLFENIDSASHFYQNALVELKPSLSRQKINSLIKLSLIEVNLGNFSEANSYIEKANSIINSSGDTSYKGQLYQLKASVYSKENNYPKASVLFKKAIEEYRQNEDTLRIGYVYTNLAEMYISIGNFPLAIDYLEKSEKIFWRMNQVVNLSNNYLQIGMTYLKSAKYSEALVYLKKAEQSFLKLNNYRKISEVYNNIGKANEKLRNFKESLFYLNSALNYKRQFGNQLGQARVLANLGDLYTKMEQVIKAQAFFHESLMYAEIVDDKELKLELYLKLSNSYSFLSDYKKAYKFQVKYNILDRNILEENNLLLIQYLKNQLNDEIISRDSEKKILRNELLLLTTSKENNNRVLVIVIVFLLVSLMLIIFLLIKHKRLNKKLIIQLTKIIDERSLDIDKRRLEFEKLENLSNRIFRIASKNMREPYLVLQRLANQISNKSYNPDRINFDKDQLIMALNLLDNVMYWAKNQQGLFDLNPQILHVNVLLDEVIKVQIIRAKAKSIKINYKANSSLVIYADKETVSFVLRNIIENAIKFSTNYSEITISTINKNDSIDIEVSDSGVGMTRDQISSLFSIDKPYLATSTYGEKGGGLGLFLSKEFVKRNFGTLHVQSSIAQGTIVNIVLPSKKL